MVSETPDNDVDHNQPKKVVVYGNGRFAEYVSYVLAEDGGYQVVAYCVDDQLRQQQRQYKGKPLVAFEQVADVFPPCDHQLFIAVGDNEIRSQKFEQARRMGYALLSYVASRATTWHDLAVGANVFISDDSVLHPFVTIGDSCLIIGARVGHHTAIGNHNLLSSCTIGGSTRIGDYCFLGMNAAIKQGISIGNRCVIGMGCTIHRDVLEGEVYTNTKTTQKSSVPYARFARKYLK